MKDFLYQPEIYGKIDIGLISKFKSRYGLALYENCIRYKGLPQTPWFPIEVFRKLMGVFDEKYSAFKDFKKRVLDIGVNEINSISPLRVIPELEPVNQKVINIRFKLTKSIEAPVVTIEQNTDNKLQQSVEDTFGFSQLMIEDVLALYEQHYIQEKIEVIMTSESFLLGKIRGLAGFLIEVLKKDYKLNKSSKIIINEQRKIKEEKDKERKLQEEDRLKRYNAYVTKKIDTDLIRLTTEQHQELMNKFDVYMKSQNSILQNWYSKKNLDHTAVKASFNHFIKEYLGNFLSMEELMEVIR